MLRSCIVMLAAIACSGTVDVDDGPGLAAAAQRFLELPDDAWRRCSQAAFDTVRDSSWDRCGAFWTRRWLPSTAS